MLLIAVTIANIIGIIGADKAVADPSWYDSNWDYRKKITINAAYVTADLTNFPVLVSLASDSDLAAKALDNGYDIFFTNDAGTKLDHEIEYFNGTTGQMVAWVKVPSVLDLTDTEIYMYYGNSGASNQQNAAGVWDSNFKVVQHMEEASGGTNAIKDSTSNGNNGTDAGSPSFGAAGKADGAISFDGTDDRINLGYGNSLSVTRPVTIEAWIKPATVPGLNTSEPVVFRDNGTNMNYAFSIANGTSYTGGTGVKMLFWREDSTDADFNTYGTTTITAGNWYYVVAVDNGSQGAAGNFAIYVNGGSAEGTKSVTMSAYDSATHKTIIADTNGETIGSGHFFNGIIDEVRISNTARSAGWITTSYNNQNSPSTFITLGAEEAAIVAPAVTTGPYTNVEETTATLNGTLSADGGEACQYSFEWGTASGVYTNNIPWTGSLTTGQTFDANISGLQPGQLYYYRAKAKNSVGAANGLEYSFTTKPDGPVALNASAAGVSQINLTWTKGAGANNTLVRGKSGSYPTSYSDGVQIYYGTGTSANLTGLSPNTTIYFRAWSETSGKLSDTYASATATTNPITSASVTTNAATSVEETTATLNGLLVDDGGQACIYSFEWGTTSGVYTDNISWTGSINTGQSFSTNLVGLNKGQKYFFRAKVQNSTGVTSGAEMEFLTKPDGPSSFTAAAISDSQIDLTWVMGDGAGRTMVRGKTGGYPADYSDGYEVYFGIGTGASDTGLSDNTTYYYRAWSEKTGSQQWSNTYASATATTNAAPPGPTAVGGKIFTINKAIVLAPWLVLAISCSMVITSLFVYIRKKFASRMSGEKKH